MFSSYRDDSSCFNSQPSLENRGQPPFLPGTNSKQTSGPPWNYSQQTFSTVPFYSGDNINHRHPVLQNTNTVPHVQNGSLLSNYNNNVISGSNVHQSVVRPRAMINCQTNCDACYSHSFTRFSQSWGAASSDCVRYGGGSSITSLSSNDIPRFPPNFPQTDDCSNRFGEDFPSTLNKLSRFSKDAQGITASIPKKHITPVTDGQILIQQNHSRGAGISEQYVSSLAIDDVITKSEGCHNTCLGMCDQGNCKIYKRSSMKNANLNSTPCQPYGMPRENVKYTGHIAGANGGNEHMENHQPSRLWLPKGHPPGIWIPTQDSVNSFEHSNAPSFWAERDAFDISSQFHSQSYEMSSSYKSANQIRTVQNISYRESMDDVQEEMTEKIHEQIPFHKNNADISRYSADIKRRPENLTTSEHAAKYIEASQRNQQKCDHTETLFGQDAHYQKPTGRNAFLSSKSYLETEINRERYRDSTASTVLLLQNSTKSLLNSNETIQNYTPSLDPHNDISKKYSFSAPTYQNHDGKFHSPVLGIAQPPSRFGSHLTYTHSKVSRNSNGMLPANYVEGSRPLSCQLPSDNETFLNQHLSYDPNKDYAGNVIHCPVQNPDAIIRCSSAKDTLESIVPQTTLSLQSGDKVTNPNVTRYFGIPNVHEVNNTSKSSNVNPAAYYRDSVVTNSFQDNAHSGLYPSSGRTFAPNAFTNEINNTSKRNRNVPVISRSDKEACHISTAYDTNSPLASGDSPDHPIKKRKSKVRNVHNMEKQMDNDRNNHILDVRQFLETWDEEMDLSPAPRLPDVVLSSSSTENPLLVLDCRQLGNNGAATLSAVDRSTEDLIQTYEQPVESRSENNELIKHAEQQFNECASLLPLNPLEEISKLCDADQKSDTKIIKQITPDSEIAPQEMPLPNMAAAEFSLNDENGVDTCSVNDGVIQELLLPSQKFENTKRDKKPNILLHEPLHDCELNEGQTSSSASHSPYRALQVANRDHISVLYSTNHLSQGPAILECHTDIIPQVQNSISEEIEEHLKKSRIQTLKQLCEYVLQQCGTPKHCEVINKNITTCSVSKPTETFSSLSDGPGTSINVSSVQDTGKMHHKQTVEMSYLLNVPSNDKEVFKTNARSEEDDILDNDNIDLDDNELWVKHSDADKQTCLLDDKVEITVKPLEDKSFKQSAKEMNEKATVAEVSCELYDNTAKLPKKINSIIITKISRNKSKKKKKSRNLDMHTKGDNLLSGDGDLKRFLTNKIPEFEIGINKNSSNEACFGMNAVEAMDFSHQTFNIVKKESEVGFSNRSEKSDNCKSILISKMRSNVSPVLANSGSESDDRYDMGMSVSSSVHNDLDIEQSQPLESHSVEISFNETNGLFNSDVMEADALMHSNMTETSDNVCCCTFETSYCKINDSKGHEKNESKTNHCRDDFSLLGDSLMQPKLELTKCSGQASQVILPNKLTGGTVVEENSKDKEELQIEQENSSNLQKSSFGSLDETLNVSGNIVLNILNKKTPISNGKDISSAQTDNMTKCGLNEESVEEFELDENQNQSSSAKLNSTVKDSYDNTDEILENSVEALVKSAENICTHLEYHDESSTIANDCGLPIMTVTNSWAKIKKCAKVSNLFNKPIEVHGPLQKSDKPAFEHIHLEGHKVSNVSRMASMRKPETKDCTELANFANASTKDVSVQEPLYLLANHLEDVHVDFKCADASTIVPNGCNVTRALITKSNETKDYSMLPYSSAKEDGLLQKSNKPSLEHFHNMECSEIPTTNDCDLPNIRITKSKLKTQDHSNEYIVADNELTLSYYSEERENKPNIASGNSILINCFCELECDTTLQENSLNIECKRNTLNLNPPDLLHNALQDSHNESEQQDTSNIKKLLKNEEGHIGIKKNLIRKTLKAAGSKLKSKKLIIESVLPRVSDNNYGTNLLISKNINQEENQSKFKSSKRKYIEEISEKRLQALEGIHNDTESNSQLHNFNTYCQNNHIDDLEISDSCEVKLIACEKMDTKYSAGHLRFSSSVIKDERSLQEQKLRCTNACLVGKQQMASARIETEKPSENEIIVNDMVGSVFQKFSNFVFNDEKLHAESMWKEEKETNSLYRNIGRSENTFIRQPQNMIADIEVVGKLRCTSKLLSKCEIKVNDWCHGALESTTSLKQQNITKTDNTSNIILESGDMSLKSAYFLQRQFSEPLIRNYVSNIKNKIKLGSVMVTDLNYAQLSDTLAELLRNKIQITVKLSTCNLRSGITNNVIMEAHKTYPHCLNSGYHYIEYLNPTRNTLLPKNKKVLKRKISQCISDDEFYHSFSKTQKKRNTERNYFDRFMIEEASSKLNSSILKSNICVENKKRDYKINTIFKNSNLQYILEFILTANNHQRGSNSEGIQECGSDDKHVPMSEDTCMALIQGNTIAKENDQRKQRLSIEKFQEDDEVEKFDHVAQKIQNAMAEEFQNDSIQNIYGDVTRIPNDLIENIQDVLAEKIEDDMTEKIEDSSKQNKSNFECVVKNMEECEMKHHQETKESNSFENCHTSVKFNHCQRNDRTCVSEEINVAMNMQERDDKNYMHLRASPIEEEEIMAAGQKQEMEIKKMIVKKNIGMGCKEAFVNNTNDIPLLPNIPTGETILSNMIQNNMAYSKDMTPSDFEMRYIHERRECVKVWEGTVDINNIPVPKINTGNLLSFKPIGNSIYKQASNKNKQGKQGDIQSLCDLLCISNALREKAFDKSLVSDNCIEAVGDFCHKTALQDVTVQKSVLNKQNISKMEILSISHNTTITDEPYLVIKPKSNLESHQLYVKASNMSTGPTVAEMDTRGNRLDPLPVIRDTHLFVRSMNSKVKVPRNISQMQKAEEGTEDIAAKIETSPIIKVGAQSLIIMHKGSSNTNAIMNKTNTVEKELPINSKFLLPGNFSGAISVASKASILSKDNCSYSLQHTGDCTINLLLSLTVHKVKSLKEIAKDIIQNLKETMNVLSTEQVDSSQVVKHENDTGLNATKDLNFCSISCQSTNLAANFDDQEKAKDELDCTIQNKIKCSSSCRLKSANCMKKDTRSIDCKVKVPDLFDRVKKKKIIEKVVTENSSMETMHDTDAYVDMPHLEAISTEISSNDSETEMPCLELIDDLEPMQVDHIQKLNESFQNKDSAQHCVVVESTEDVVETKEEEPSVHAKIAINVNRKLSSNPELYIEMQNLLETANHFQQVYLEAASKETSSFYLLKGKSPIFIDNMPTALKLCNKKPEAKVPIDYSVLKSILPVGNQNAQSTCESSLKLCHAHSDRWNDLGYIENYSPQSDNSERIVSEEMHFSNKEKCVEAEPPRAFPICTESDSIPLQILESETEYMHCVNAELNSKKCWTSEKIVGDNRYIAGEEACDFNTPSQVCSDVFMSNCESEINIQECLELDMPSLVDSAPSQLEPPEISSSLGDIIPADFVTNWPYLEEEVLCEPDKILCSADSDYQTLSNSSAVAQCLPYDFYGTVNSSSLDSNLSSKFTDTASLGEFKCSLSWKKIFNVSKLDRKQRKNFKKAEKEGESMVTSVSRIYYNMTGTQNKNIRRQNCMPLNYHTNTSMLTSNNKEFGGLELGPAKIEVRIPRLANTKGLPKVWKVIDRSKPLKVPEAQKENKETNGRKSDALGQVPIVVVKRLILKRSYDDDDDDDDDDEDVNKTKKRKHSHKKTNEHLSEKRSDVHRLLKHVNALQVIDNIYESNCDSDTQIAKECNEKPRECRTDGTIMRKNDLRNTNKNISPCSENAGEICCTSMASSTEGVLARDKVNQNVANENSCVLSCSEKIFSNNNTDISECTEQQRAAQKIPKVIIKRTVGVDNTNKYRSFLTDSVLSNHTRSLWNPVVRLERNASLDSLAKKVAAKKKATEEAFAQHEMRHGIKINLKSPPGTPAVTIVSLSSAVPINKHSHKRRKHLYSRKKRSSALEEQNLSVTSTVLNISSDNGAQLSSSCRLDEWESCQETTENQVALSKNVTRLNLNDTNFEDCISAENKECKRKEFTKITFHRHKKKRKTESNKRKKNSSSNFEHSISNASKHSFLYLKNGVQQEHCQLDTYDFSADDKGDKNSCSASEKSAKQIPEIFLPSEKIELNESHSGCVTSRSKANHISELSDLMLSSDDFVLVNGIQKQSFVKSNKGKKRHVEEEFTSDELPLFHPDRIVTYSKKKKPTFKEKSQPPDEQELEKEIKDLCSEMALRSPSTEETNASMGDAPQHGKSCTTLPEMMCCQVNGHLYEQNDERVSQNEQVPFHCQQCDLSFKSEDNFINHLAEQHPHMKAKHHCLLCERTFPSAERHKLHLAGQTHRHLELIQRRTIHALFSLFTGHSCPVLEPLTQDELTGLNWLPVEPGTIHFYHQNTPLQQVIQNLVSRKEERNLATTTTQSSSSAMPEEEDPTASEHLIK